MIKEHQFWFPQWQPVSVTMVAPVWSASYDLTSAPTTWTKGQTQGVTVIVKNTGNVAWPSTGYQKVDLEVHLTTQTGGTSKIAYWLTNNTQGLSANLAPGASAAVTVQVTMPSTAPSGSMFLEAEMIKEHQFWFQQFDSIPVTVS
jgi:hypothetical protein